MHIVETSADTRKQIVYNKPDHDWTALYDGAPIGTFARPSAARQALDDHAFTLAQHRITSNVPGSVTADQAPTAASDPLTLYSGNGPHCGVVVTGDALDQALLHFCTVYEQPNVRERAARARALLANRERWEVLPNGAVRVIGKQATYLVTSEICRTAEGKECPDQKYRVGVTGGQCYHTIARELVRLAQHLRVPPDLSASDHTPAGADADTLACVTLPGRLLGLAMSIMVQTAQPLRCGIAPQWLTLTPPDDVAAHAVTLSCVQSTGSARIQIAPDMFASLWDTFRPRATKLEQLQLFIDVRESLLVLGAEDFHAQVSGVILPEYVV